MQFQVHVRGLQFHRGVEAEGLQPHQEQDSERDLGRGASAVWAEEAPSLNFQVFKMSSFQVFKFSSFQIFKFSGFQVFRFSSFQVFKFSSFQVLKNSSFQVFKF